MLPKEAQPIHISRTIRDDKTGHTYISEETFPVSNLDTTWMLQEHNLDEVDQVLEGWVQGYQLHFTQPKDSSIAKDFDVDKPLNIPSARIMAYSLVNDEYHRLTSSAQQRINDLEAQRLAQRQDTNDQVKRKQLSQGKAEQRRKAIENQFQVEVFDHQLELSRNRTIQNLIARKFIHDQFSPVSSEVLQPLHADNIIPAVEGTLDLPNARELILNFYSDMNAFLQSPESVAYLEDYNYKNSPRLSRNREDCSVLAAAIKLGLKDHMTQDTEMNNVLSEIGTSFLSGLSQKAVRESQNSARIAHNKYPILTYFYDTLNSAMTIDNISRYRSSMPVLMEKVFKNALRNFSATAEFKELVKNEITESIEFAQNNTELLGQVARPEGAIPRQLLEFMTRDNRRLRNGISISPAILFSLESFKGPFNRSQSIEYFSSITGKELEKSNNNNQYHAAELALENASHMGQNTAVYNGLGISVDLIHATIAHFKNADEWRTRKINSAVTDTTTPAQEAKLREMDTPAQIPFKKRVSNSITNFAILEAKKRLPPGFNLAAQILNIYSDYHYTIDSLADEEAKAQADTETKELWKNVLNKSMWFVSPRGDQFKSEYDPELRNIDLDSVTFRIDPRHPRDHKVEIQMDGVDFPIVLWLDKNKMILDELRQPLATSSDFKVQFTNLLLNRLNFITSGVMSQLSESERRMIEDTGLEEGPNFTYRRAHYRVYSDPGITMTSLGAQRHADEIREEYGIDIGHETRRRRYEGTLGPAEYLTFVRESLPVVRPEKPRPNVIIYKPELFAKLDRKRGK